MAVDCTYSDYLGSYEECLRLERAASRRDRTAVPRWSQLEQRDGVLRGDILLASIEHDIATCGLTLSPPQLQVVHNVLNSALPIIYGVHDFEQHRERILRARGVHNLRQWTVVSMARQMGKTTVLAVIVAALACNIRNLKVLVVSTTRKASSALVKHIGQRCKTMDKQHFRLHEVQDALSVMRDDGSTGTVHAVANTAKVCAPPSFCVW